MSNLKKVKILHTTMSLDIGGAETHIVELTKYLNNDDYEILVASNGGVYVELLEEAGIKHFKVPLYTKNPFKVLASYFGLKRIIRQENIDIVHAHARIPAFISGIICRRQGKVIVTTTHGRFKVNWLLRKISNWGNKSIAVSEDLKDYLLKEYNYSEEDVYLSVNGIDTEVFKPDSNQVDIVGSAAKRNIVHVSRLDSETSRVCEYLIELAPDLHKMDSGIRIIVAGGGTELKRLRDAATEVNARLGFTMIDMIGPVSDIPKLLDKADMFVGISRAFLEAMNYQIPMILAGNPGMMGLLSQDMLAACEHHNFTCRDEEPLDRDKLLKALQAGLDSSSADNSWMRTYIEMNYSVAKMAEPYDRLYKDFMNQPRRYVIAGYYGYSNSGDDALLDSTCRDIHNYNNDNDITILTNAAIDRDAHYMARSIYRFNFLKVLSAIRNADILIMGGGTLLQDTTSSRSIWYYLAIIWMANCFKKKTYLYANGIGPIYRPYNRWLTRLIANNIDIITLRENQSGEELKRLGIERPYIQVTADPVFSLPFDEPRDISGYLQRSGIDISKPYCTAIFRSWKDDSQFIDKLALVCDYVKQTYDLQILFIPMKYPSDKKIAGNVMEHMTEESCLLEDKCDVQTLVEIIGSGTLSLSMRLHGILYSALKHVPVVGFSYDVKINYYTSVLDMPLIEDVMNINTDEALEAVDHIMSNYEETKTILEKKLIIQKQESHNNAILLRNLF